MTLRGVTLNVTGTGATGIAITADNVTIDRVTVNGRQATAYVSSEHGISAVGTASNHITGLRITDSTIRRSGGWGGIYTRHTTGALIDGNTIEDVVYTGMLLAAMHNGTVSDNTVRRVGLFDSDAHSNNAYGITVTYQSGDPMSSDVIVERNTIERVPTWHGLDTHGGIRVTFRDNIVRGARRAIFLTLSPTAIVASGNTLTAPTAAEIAACPADAPLAYCQDINGISISGGTGSITNNTGIGWGGDWWNPISGASGYTFGGNSPPIP